MAIAASPTVSTMPSTDLATALAGLQQAVQALSDVVQQLQARVGTGPAAGAATLAGGPGQSPMQGGGCGCGGGMGAVAGADQIGQAPPPKGANGAPAAAILGAAGAPEPMQSDKADKADKADDKASGLGEQMVAEAKKHLGAKYVYGAAGPDTFDCSGLMLYVARKFGIDLPHKASIQATKGTKVDKGDLKPGDMVFFQDGPEISHVGMYVGDGKYIHAPKTGDVVKISDLDDSWARSHFATARRMG